MKPDVVRRNTIDSKIGGWVIDGSLTGAEIVATLADLRFARDTGYIETIYLDADARDWLLRTLRRAVAICAEMRTINPHRVCPGPMPALDEAR